jgi:HlyD family secretion protein
MAGLTLSGVTASFLAFTLATGVWMSNAGWLSSAEGAGPAFDTVPVERGTLTETTTATGTVEATGTVKVGTQLSGQVAELFTDFNEPVSRGQLVARLDPAMHEAALAEARAAVAYTETLVRIREAAVERELANLRNAEAGIALVDAEIARAKAAEVEASRDFERKRTLYARGEVSQRDHDAATARLAMARSETAAAQARRAINETQIAAAHAAMRMAEAELANAHALVEQRGAALRQAELMLERTEIRAPVDGIVIARDVDRGQTVAASLQAPTLFTIARDLRKMEVHARIDEADIGRIRVGQRARFTVDAFPGHRFDGIVRQIRKSPEVTQNVVTYRVLIGAENRDLKLLPGMTAAIEIVVSETPDVLLVPNAALRFQPPPDLVAQAGEGGATAGGQRVWTLDPDGRPRPVPVAIGNSGEGTSELAAGDLAEGQPLITGVRQREERPILTRFLGS